MSFVISPKISLHILLPIGIRLLFDIMRNYRFALPLPCLRIIFIVNVSCSLHELYHLSFLFRWRDYDYASAESCAEHWLVLSEFSVTIIVTWPRHAQMTDEGDDKMSFL